MPSAPDLSRLIPLTARTILDIGSAVSSRDIYRLNPNVRLLAPVDGDVPAALAAAETAGGADCIILGQALERSPDPTATLRECAAVLSPDGMMLISVANPDHWRIARRLLRGSENDDGAESEGRRFGIETIRRMIAGSGLLPLDVQPRIDDEASGLIFIKTLTPALRDLGVDPEDYARAALPSHYLWRAGREPVRRIVIAGDLLTPVGGVSHLRVIHPLTALATDPAVTTHFARAGHPPDDFPADGTMSDTLRIFVMHRPALFGADGQILINRMIDRGWLVITEFDDHPDYMQGLNDPALVTFRGVHAVQTTTPELARVFRQRNPEVALFPNAIASLPDIRNFTDPRVLTVFFGALNREPDWRPLMSAVNAVAARAGGRLRFRVVHDEGFFHALETPHKSFTPLCDYETYMDLLGTSEISLMPLDDTPFNRAKSDLKFIEAGACRVAALASSVVYRDSIAHGENGLIFANPDEFHREFLRLTAIPDLALALGENARRMVSKHRMLADQVAPRIAWYRELWQRRAALTQAIRLRIDGLPMPAG